MPNGRSEIHRNRIRLPKCPICQSPFTDHNNNNNNNHDDNTTPLLLQCGHTFCYRCLSSILSTQPQSRSLNPHSKPSLSCPKCRHVSPLGNSLLSLPKNFALLSLLSAPAPAASSSLSDSDDDDDSDGGEGDDDRHRPQSSRCCLRGVNGLDYHELKGNGQSGLLLGKGCKHRVVVRKVGSADVADVDWAERELESLRRRSVWCRNVCGFHGVVRREDALCIVTEKCYGSVQSQMQKSGGRLTLDQILR